MKTATLIILLLAFTTMVQAQRYTDIVKVQPLSMIGNSLTAEWEHIEGRNALTVTVGVPVDAATKKNWFNAPSKLHTYNIRAGYRHYTGIQKTFYLEPYLKCQTIDWGSKLKQGWTEGYLFTTNAGISVGYQVTWKHLVLDIYPIGIEVGRMNGRLNTYSKSDADSEFMESYVRELSQRLPDGSEVNISRDAGRVEAVLNLKTYFWMRSGVSIGYRFQRK